MRVLVFGDSIVEGAFDCESGSWVHRLSGHSYKTDSDTSFYNLGISGDCTNRLLNRFKSEATTRIWNKNGAIIFSIGINDTQRWVKNNSLKTEPENFRKNLHTLIDQARTLTDKIIFLGLLPIVEERVQPMPWANDRSHHLSDVTEYNDIINNVCIKEKVYFVSMSDVLGSEYSDILVDGIHPNTKGHKLIFEHLKKALGHIDIL